MRVCKQVIRIVLSTTEIIAASLAGTNPKKTPCTLTGQQQLNNQCLHSNRSRQGLVIRMAVVLLQGVPQVIFLG